MNYRYILLVFLLCSCAGHKFKDNPTYKACKDKGLITGDDFLFIIPGNNGSIEFPDVHTFDRNGRPLYSRNCANAIDGFIKVLHDTAANSLLNGAPDINTYLKNNRLFTSDGKRFTKEKLPDKDFYIFYCTMYMMLDHGNNDTAVLQHVRNAQKLANRQNIAFYLVTPSS